MPPKTKPKKEKPSYTAFKVMLYVDSDGIPHWQNGATDYFNAISQCEQRKGYCMQCEREENMRREFDRLENLPPPEPDEKKRDVAELEKQYGNMIRNLWRKQHIPVEQLAKQFKLNISDVKMMVRES